MPVSKISYRDQELPDGGERIVLSLEAFDAFEALLDAPPNPKVAESLRALLRRPSPWESGAVEPRDTSCE